MANVDVSDLLVDPDFIDPMQVVSRFPQVDSYGENYVAESVLNAFGSIQPATGKALERVPESLREVNLRSFWFKGVITATSPGRYPSILIFRGERYQVKVVFDWTNFGQGWTEGLCVAERPSA